MTNDNRPHSRACGIRMHDHGPACSRDCPTCTLAVTAHQSETTAPADERTDFRSEIKTALNRASAENGSDTPDHILADYLLACLDAFDAATHARSDWYGHHQTIGATTAEVLCHDEATR